MVLPDRQKEIGMSAKHAPGPWRAIAPTDEGEGAQFINWFVGSDVPAVEGLAPKTLVSVMQATAYSEGNARLIAAAPDMLDALWLFARMSPSHPPAGISKTAWEAALSSASAAIAKAEGAA